MPSKISDRPIAGRICQTDAGDGKSFGDRRIALLEHTQHGRVPALIREQGGQGLECGRGYPITLSWSEGRYG